MINFPSFLISSSLEALPNELLFMIIAHLSSSDIVQAFYGLNHRFNWLVYQSVRHFAVSTDASEKFFYEFNPNIKSIIEKICIDARLLPQVFLSTSSYSNLRSIVLRCLNLATIDLNVDCYSAKNIIHSCLDVLQVCNILPIDWNDDKWFDDSKYHSRSEENCQAQLMLNKLVCPTMTRLYIDSCSEETLFSLCTLAPNLIYLRIKQLVSTDDDSNFNPIVTLIPQPSTLKQLHIAATTNRLDDIQFIGRLIDCYQSSLEYLTLEVSLKNPVGGYYLQRILEPCQHLKKFTFDFNYWNDDTEEIDVVHQFQSDWWLDSQRPPVLIFCGSHRETLIISMPCNRDDYTWFPIDPKDWLLNKGHIGSLDICFTKQKCIRFVNSNRHPITFELVHIIGHVFRAPKQELAILHWAFDASDILLEQLINIRSGEPRLPMVYSLDLNSCDLDQLAAKTLIIWLLLASNVKVINVCQGTTSAKIQLINRLKVLLEGDKRLKFITDAIEEIHVFYMFDALNYATKQHICQMYSSIFRKPVIRR